MGWQFRIRSKEVFDTYETRGLFIRRRDLDVYSSSSLEMNNFVLQLEAVEQAQNMVYLLLLYSVQMSPIYDIFDRNSLLFLELKFAKSLCIGSR